MFSIALKDGDFVKCIASRSPEYVVGECYKVFKAILGDALHIQSNRGKYGVILSGFTCEKAMEMADFSIATPEDAAREHPAEKFETLNPEIHTVGTEFIARSLKIIHARINAWSPSGKRVRLQVIGADNISSSYLWYEAENIKFKWIEVIPYVNNTVGV